MVKIEDIPADVQWVWCIQWCRHPIGLDTLAKIHKIISDNPKYFPWETKYDSIPKEVHDAYWNEKNAESNKRWAECFKNKAEDDGFIGVIPTALAMAEPPTYPPEPQKSFSEMMADLFKMEEDKRKRQDEEDARNEALWDKYYKPYGLEYRK